MVGVILDPRATKKKVKIKLNMAITNHIITGKANWFKAVGAPVGGYPDGKGPLEWTFDLVLDSENIEKLLATGCAAQYIKENKDGDKYVRFTRKAVKMDGTPGKAIKIVDSQNKDWDETKLIGNGSVLNVSFTLNEVGMGKDKRFKPSVLAVQVWELETFTKGTGFTTKTEAPASESWADDEAA